jgi:peptidoglycan-associated lipoprotein
MVHGFSRSLPAIFMALLGALLMAGCKTTPSAEAPVTAAPAFESSAAPAERVDESSGFKDVAPQSETVRESDRNRADRLNAQGVLKRVHFDFDKYDLRPDAIRTLGDNAGRIKEHSEFKVRIEGHCDERGTVEYNLALGEKRARAARDYLVSLGIPTRRLSIISFGKERPIDPGHNEEAWALNRRAEFVFQAE